MKPQTCSERSESINTDEHRKHPDEMTTWEFMNEELYQIALKGGYQKEFNEVKERLSSLNAYQNVGEFMKALWNDKPLREKIILQLKRLWQDDYGFRQSSGLVLMLAMWRNAIGAGDDYWSNLFINLATDSTDWKEGGDLI